MHHNQGLNLVEVVLIIVVLTLIIGLSFSLMPSKFPPHRRPYGTQFRGIHQSMVMYAQSNRGYFPGLNSEGEAVAITVEERTRILLDHDFFEPDYLIGRGEQNKQAWTDGPFTSDHYSHAMLQIPTDGGRLAEWRETLNSDAIVMSDRNTAGTTDAPESIYTRPGSGDWRGGVVRNDNSVTFETTHLHDTEYAGHVHTDDHLFEAAGDDDAYLIHSGN